MKVFAIGDLHFDNKNEKPMNIFGDNWINHEKKIIDSWLNKVEKDDLVLVPGDISWAVKLNDAVDDLIKIDRLTGIKILGKGNHDYWWSTANKLDKLGMSSISFLKNNSYEFEGVSICGTRGWDSMEETLEGQNDKKIYDRELNRFRMSMEQCSKNNNVKIAMMHFPPFDNNGKTNEFVDLMKEYGIDICIYGHLHGDDGHKLVREGKIDDIIFHCVASDYLKFDLKEIL